MNLWTSKPNVQLQAIHSLSEDTEVAHIIGQLGGIKEEDSQPAFTSSDLVGGGELLDPDSALGSARSGQHPLQHQQQHHHLLTPTQRSLSIESASTWDSRFADCTTRSVSPVKKLVAYPDPPPSFLLSANTRVEYDREGRLHYVPRSIARGLSYEPGRSAAGSGESQRVCSTFRAVQRSSDKFMAL